METFRLQGKSYKEKEEKNIQRERRKKHSTRRGSFESKKKLNYNYYKRFNQRDIENWIENNG